MRQFRVAFIKHLFRKSSAEAENLERRVFARLNHQHQDVSLDWKQSYKLTKGLLEVELNFLSSTKSSEAHTGKYTKKW